MWLYCYGLPRILLAEIYIPFLLETAVVLATFIHPNHTVYLCSWGFALLPPTCNSKGFWYIFSASTYLLKYHLCF
ncbi:hypothetical protein B7943_06400 [Vibrio cholerae]|nr:hypothetical protein [Vibrio cholerae]ORP17854.1 hypothetical protein B7943_06400 [Vibrio cholerae]